MGGQGKVPRPLTGPGPARCEEVKSASRGLKCWLTFTGISKENVHLSALPDSAWDTRHMEMSHWHLPFPRDP